MKNINFYLIIALSSLLFACESKTGEWEDPVRRIQFTGDTTLTKSFIFDTPDRLTDTVYLSLHTIGHVSDQACEFLIAQVTMEGEENAIEGEDYLSLKSDELKKHLVVEPRKSNIRVPIVISRTSLIGKIRKAKFIIIENDNFKFGLKDSLTRVVCMSNSYEEPAMYGKAASWMGMYSKVKHEFMHKVLLKYNFGVPDNDFFGRMMTESTYSFYQGLFQRELKEYNDTHSGNPLTSEPLLPDYPNGIIIKFEKQ